MKKIIAILFSCMFYCVINAQKIQDQFFGYGYYTEMNYMERAMNREGYSHVRENANKLCAYNVKFGGIDWPFVNFGYHENQLYKVSFSINYNDKHQALSTFKSLKKRLSEKYKGVYNSESLNDFQLKDIVYLDEYRGVSLDIEYAESKGGKKYYYVNLTYVCLRLLEEVEQMNDSDL